MSKLAGLGRIVSVDERDKQYQLPRRQEAAVKQQRYWPTQTALDQLDTPQCVGFSGYRWLTTFPVKNLPKFSPADLYRKAQDNDQWPGNNYDGSSVRGLFKALKIMGYVSEYRWASDVATIVDHLLAVGPVVVGTDWHEGMFMPDRHGFIDDIGGTPVGGHAYLLVGASRTKRGPNGVGAVRILNSWGANWGEKGRAWLSFAALEELIKNQGEACASNELHVV